MTRINIFLSAFLLTVTGCEDDHGTEADELGVGAECAVDDDCNRDDHDTDGMPDQECLTQFAGGYCGVQGCQSDGDCPEASACVAHEDGNNYCFRTCSHKDQCNANRHEDVWSNCSSNVVFVDAFSGKACVPPSSG